MDKSIMQELDDITAKFMGEIDRVKESIGKGVPSGPFIPEIGQEYHYINRLGEAVYRYWDSTPNDRHNLAMGNCFRTEAEAIAYRDRNYAKQRIIRKMRELEAAEGVEAVDWSKKVQPKFYVAWNHNKDIAYLDSANRWQSSESYAFTTSETVAMWICDNMKDDIKLILGVES